MVLQISKDNFELNKCKLLKTGGIESDTDFTVATDGSFNKINRTEKNPITAHPDLENAIRGLKDFLLISCGYMIGRTVVNSADFKATKAQKEAIEKQIAIFTDKTNVTGISISGEDKTEGVIIMGKIKAENGSNIAINSPRMRFGVTTYGFEEELQKECDLITDEVYEYLYNSKKAQLDILPGDEKASSDK